jgi:hypothetical protein
MRPPKVTCPCGARYTARIIVEYISFQTGHIEYSGGRFCYVNDQLDGIRLPAGAIPVQVIMYDLREPDQIIYIDLTDAE